MGDKCQIANSLISAYETGKKNPGLVTLATIAKELGVSIDRLYYGDENSAFIDAEPNAGKKIVNSLKLLWEQNVIFINPNIQYPPTPGLYGESGFPLSFGSYQFAVVRVLTQKRKHMKILKSISILFLRQ